MRRRRAPSTKLPRAPRLQRRVRQKSPPSARVVREPRTGPACSSSARPYHMDPGIGHETGGPSGLRLPILWASTADRCRHPELAFGEDVRAGTSARRRHPPTGGRPRTAQYQRDSSGPRRSRRGCRGSPAWCGSRATSGGMDQPTYTPSAVVGERSGTLFFSFQDLDSTKPAGSVKIPRRDHRPLPREVRSRHPGEEGRPRCRRGARSSFRRQPSSSARAN